MVSVLIVNADEVEFVSFTEDFERHQIKPRHYDHVRRRSRRQVTWLGLCRKNSQKNMYGNDGQKESFPLINEPALSPLLVLICER